MNKNNIWLGIILSVVLLASLACQVSFGGIGKSTVRGSGDVIVVDRPVSSFERIDFNGVGQMVIEIGEQESLRIEAEDNILKQIETEISADTLVIDIKKRISIHPTEPIRYYVTVVNLESISVSGAGSVEAPQLDPSKFSVHISGAGNVAVDSLEASSLDVKISGLGGLTINGGQVDTQEIRISGSGSHKATDMESAEADIQLSGLGDASVWVTEQLIVDISGAGSVRYAGNPSVSSNISGLGNVQQIGE